MDALLMINPGAQAADIVTPAKPLDKHEAQFGKVLNEKQQAQQQHKSRPVDRQPEVAEGLKDEQGIASSSSNKAEPRQETAGHQDLADVIVAETNPQMDVEEVPQQQAKIQHSLAELLKILTQHESLEDGEGSDQVELLLNDLVQQLEMTDPEDEDVLAEVDLPMLAAELQSVDEESDNREFLAQLVVELKEQITNKPSLPEHNPPAVAVTEVEPQQQVALAPLSRPDIAAVATEELPQIRQVLQNVVDSPVPAKAVIAEAAMDENIVAEEQQGEETTFTLEETAEKIDPRFSGLLKPRVEQQPVQQAHLAKEPIRLQHSRQQSELNQNEPIDQILPEKVLEQKQGLETGQVSGGTTRQIMENLVQQSHHNLQSHTQIPAQGLEVGRAIPQTPMIQLANGYQVAESQIFDQVVTQISGSLNGESGRMVLRLQPAELGSLKLELKIEGDRICANFHAQTHQVQEVLERNLPQLRNALAEQGLKIDQFQVNIDRGHDQQSQFDHLAQQQNHGSEKQSTWQRQDLEPEEQIIPLAHLMQNGGGGISLHV